MSKKIYVLDKLNKKRAPAGVDVLVVELGLGLRRLRDGVHLHEPLELHVLRPQRALQLPPPFPWVFSSVRFCGGRVVSRKSRFENLDTLNYIYLLFIFIYIILDIFYIYFC